MKDSIILYAGQVEALEDFTLEERGEVMTAIMAHIQGREVPKMSRAAAIAWSYIKRQAAFDSEKYAQKVAARAEAGRKGAESRWQNDGKNMAKDGKAWQTMAKMAESESESVYESESDSVPRLKEGPGEGTAPARADIEAYAKSIGYRLDVDAFIDKYQATGWTLGGQPIRDWKALVRRWQKQDEKSAGKVHNFDERSDDLDEEMRRKWRERLAGRVME